MVFCNAIHTTSKIKNYDVLETYKLLKEFPELKLIYPTKILPKSSENIINMRVYWFDIQDPDVVNQRITALLFLHQIALENETNQKRKKKNLLKSN